MTIRKYLLFYWIPAFARMTIRTITIYLFLIVFFSNCLHSLYKTPKVAIPEKWKAQNVIDGNKIELKNWWWKTFNDPFLNQLIDKAIAVNSDLAIANIRIQKAELMITRSKKKSLPTIGVGLNSSISRNFEKKSTKTTNSISGDTSYEIDIWGKSARHRDIAVLEKKQQKRKGNRFYYH